MTTLFWLSALVVVYVYIGYPILIAMVAAARRRGPVDPGDGSFTPPVSIVIAARNEAARLPARLDNLLALDYPADRRQVIVVSDGSTDATLEALAPYRDRVEIVALPAVGKAVALNAGVAAARHEVLVFGDARQRWAPEAVRALVARFRDPAVGAVSGELVLDVEEDRPAAGGSSIGDGVGLYWRYEKWLRRSESRAGSMLGVTGAIYAARRPLWRPLPAGTLLDDVLAPMRIVLGGHRVVFEPRARAFDRVSANAEAERRRKVRTLAGNYQILRLEPRLLVPGANPVWLQYLSHKVGRLLVPWALVALFVASVGLAGTGGVYDAALVAQVVFYALAGYGAVLDRRAQPGPRRPGAAPAPTPFAPEKERAGNGLAMRG